MAKAPLRWRLSVFRSRWRDRLRYVLNAPRVYQNWWAMPLPKIGMDIVLRLRDGTRYHVRGGTLDLSVVNEQAFSNPYLGSGFVTLNTDAVVIDVGANIGDFAIMAARKCPAGRVVAVEPLRSAGRIIEAQARLINLHVVGVPSLFAADVPFRSDSTLDCEGAEWDILPAAESVLPQVRQIAMQFHCERGWTAEKLADWLRSRGFVVRHTGGTWSGLLWARRE
jgi:hypothetical protein